MSRRINFHLISLAIGAAGMLLALPASAATGNAAREDIPITDPTLLERLGFEPDARNVYATPQAFADLMMDPAERVALGETRRAQRLAAQDDSPLGGPYGTQARGYTPVSPYGLRPVNSSVAHIAVSGERRCLAGSSQPRFDADLGALPHGARWRFVDVWVRDDSAAPNEDLVAAAFSHCQPDLDPGEPEITVFGTASTSGAPGNTRLEIATGVDIDLESCAYFVQVFLGTENNNCPFGSALAIQKVRAEWRRQVSPAPAFATFADVPTSHLFFRHIEALAASGITAGCGGDDFCPDAPLTRGQMAVFLATALGLHWGAF